MLQSINMSLMIKEITVSIYEMKDVYCVSTHISKPSRPLGELMSRSLEGYAVFASTNYTHHVINSHNDNKSISVLPFHVY